MITFLWFLLILYVMGMVAVVVMLCRDTLKDSLHPWDDDLF